MKHLVETAFEAKHGVKNAWHIPSVKQRVQKTIRERYGVDYPMQANSVKQRLRENSLVKHGVTNPAMVPEVVARIQATWDKKDKKELVERVRQTNQIRYGVNSSFQLPHVIESHKTLASQEKRHATMKRNGSYRKSKPEDKLYTLLIERFGVDAIERQVPIAGTRWLIDFYVKPIDTYIQIDGVYWHGLDRPIEEIIKHKTKRDVQIHKKWLTDREQDAFFHTKGLRLVRVTDKNRYASSHSLLGMENGE